MRTDIVAGVVLLAVTLACPAFAEPECDRVAQVWLDDTGSVAPASVNQTAFQAVQIIAGLSDAKRICRIDIYQFAEQAIHATPFHRVQLPTPELPQCATAQVSGELGWFKHVQKTASANAAEACKSKHKEWNEHQATLRRNEFAKAEAAINSRRKPDGRCTALTDVARRLARTPSTNVKLAVIVTDAIESCNSSSRPVEAPKAALNTFMVVMPNTVRRNTGVDFEHIAANWRRFAPWINLVLPDELGDVLR